MFSSVAPVLASLSRPVDPVAESLLEAWQDLEAVLTPELLSQASDFSFNGEERLDWHYIPRQRQGLPIGNTTAGQRARLERFLRAGMGEAGVAKVHGVIEVEEVLYERSGRREMRNPGNYFLSIYGSPGATGAWGWRFEGHHLSVNFTVLDGEVVSVSPTFFGANPAEVREGPKSGLRVLAREEDMARELLATFVAHDRQRVVIDDIAPRDILTEATPRAEMGSPEGVAMADMTEPQSQLLIDLIGIYTRRLHPDLAGREISRIRDAGLERVHFAWAGSAEPGQPHYYRIHGPTFVIEYDNTQNNANHIHTAWRDFARDFGYDPLRAHLARDHGLKVAGLETHADDAADQPADRLHARLHAEYR